MGRPFVELGTPEEEHIWTTGSHKFNVLEIFVVVILV